ncbi:MAG: methyl-accepting chemotaxis protein [Hyphomicrobiales bacterium]|nr:methyl-accepting chemotaxis protein [Hyphomicrobiales bacterium]
MFHNSSLGARLVLTVLVIATVAFTAFVSLTILRLDRGLSRQTIELSELAEQNLTKSLAGEARLARSRLEFLFTVAERNADHIAERTDVVSAISSNNVVAITEVLDHAVRTSNLDGILVVDTKMRGIGANSYATDLLVANEFLPKTGIPAIVGALLADNDRAGRFEYKPRESRDRDGEGSRYRDARLVVALDETLAKAVGAQKTAPFAVIHIEPVFDDFGDVAAALIAHRILRSDEPTLRDLAEVQDASITVMSGSEYIAWAGLELPLPEISIQDGEPVFNNGAEAYLSHCSALFEQWRICSLAPTSELQRLQDAMVAIGQREGGSLAKWLFFVATISLATCGLVTLLATRRLIGPMTHITQAVRAVALGDWKADVPGRDRRDEVGEIARAVVVLQRSLKDRDRMREEYETVEAVTKRHDNVENAIKRFDREMRSVLLSVTDAVESMDEKSRELASVTTTGQGEADETVFVAESLRKHMDSGIVASEQMAASLKDMANLIREMAASIMESHRAARKANDSTAELAEAGHQLEDFKNYTAEILRRTSFLGLNSVFHSARTVNGDDDHEEVISDMEALSSRISKADQELRAKSEQINSASKKACELVAAVSARIDTIVENTDALTGCMTRQSEVIGDMENCLDVAMSNIGNVSASAARLRATIGEAQATSEIVVSQAVDVADEARRLDTTVKTFLTDMAG